MYLVVRRVRIKTTSVIQIFFQLMPDTTVSYFTIRCIELKSSIVEGYEKDSLERFLNQYVSRGVQGPVRYFCESELQVYSKIRVVMEFMQQDLTSVNEIFETIQTIELDQWSLGTNVKMSEPRLVRQIRSAEHQLVWDLINIDCSL